MCRRSPLPSERVLIINQVVFDEWRTVEGFETVFPEGATRFFSINGQREPIIRMRPGEVQRWRILHAGYQDDIFMALEGHDLHQIARDGIALSQMDQPVDSSRRGSCRRSQGNPAGSGPARRRAGAGGRSGNLRPAGLAYFQGYDAPTGPLATVVVEGEPLPMNLPTTLPAGPLRLDRR